MDGMSASLAVVLTTLLGGRAFAERYGESPGQGGRPARLGPHPRGLERHPPGVRRPRPRPARLRRHAGAGQRLEHVGVRRVGAPSASTRPSARGDRPVLVGHSFGGRVAVRLAATNPELVRGLVLTGVPLLRPRDRRGQRRRSASARCGSSTSGTSSPTTHGEGAPQARLGRLPRGRGRDARGAGQGGQRGLRRRARRARGATGCRWRWSGASTTPPRTVAMAEQARARIGAHADLVVVPGSAHLLDEALVAALRTGHRPTGGADRERNRERAGRAGHLAARAGVVPALVAGRAARALRAGPAAWRWPRSGAGPSRANVLALAAVLVLCLVGLKLAAGRPGRRRRCGCSGRPGLALLRPSQKLVWTAARAPARGDHRRAARRGHRLLPGLRRGGRAGAAAGAADRRGRAAGRAPARGAPRPQLRGLGRREDQAGRRRAWSRSPGPTARRRPRTTPRT